MKLSNKKGFTIVEVLVAVTVTSLLLMVIMNFMADGLINFAIIQARRDVLVQAQEALDKVADETRLSANADDVNRWPDNNAPNAPADLYSWKSDSNTLIVATAAEDSSRNIIFSDPSKYITEKNNNIYFVKNGTLYRRILASSVSGNSAKTTCPASLSSSSCPADPVLINNVSNFTIKYIDGSGAEVAPTSARSVEIDINISKSYYGKTITADYQTRMVFRND